MAMETCTIQRPLKGSRISSFYPVKTLPPLSSLDSAFQIQEYISLLIRRDVHDVDAIVSIPGKGTAKDRDIEGAEDDAKRENGADKEGADKEDAKSEIAVDEACWIYEQLRRIAQDLSHPLITMLQQECTRQTCPEMKAGEWLYLCVAHGNDGAMEQCCAIDYILHTLDGATALLNSPRAFPSRLSIPPSSHRHFSSLARRLSRIFAHAYFHHRAAFAQAEAESALYARFLALTARFNLVPAEFLVVPPRFAAYISAQDDDDADMGRTHGESVPPRPLGAPTDTRTFQEMLMRHDQPAPADAARGPAGDVAEDAGEREASPAGPRRIGRSRTDTMVHSEAASVMEELGKSESEAPHEAVVEERPLSAIQVEEPVLAQLEPQEEAPAPAAATTSEAEPTEHAAPMPEESAQAVAEQEVDVTAAVEADVSAAIEPIEPVPTLVSLEEPAAPESFEHVADLSISELTLAPKASQSEAPKTVPAEETKVEEEAAAPPAGSTSEEIVHIQVETLISVDGATAPAEAGPTEESHHEVLAPDAPGPEAVSEAPVNPSSEPEAEQTNVEEAAEAFPEPEPQTEQMDTVDEGPGPADAAAEPQVQEVAEAEPAGEDSGDEEQKHEEGPGDHALAEGATDAVGEAVASVEEKEEAGTFL